MLDGGFVAQLIDIVGRKFIYSEPRATKRFRTGFRSGQGDAEAVVLPGTLLELWRVVKKCVAADKIIILQAANTSLTEGSTPNGSYDRGVVIINTLRLNKIHVLDEGKQIVSHAGGTLFELEKLLKPLGRQPHSIIGSSCIGASIVGGVCNNSGGMLVQRGPSFTELSLFAQLREDGELELINHLGIALGGTPEEILIRLERGDFSDADVDHNSGRASDDRYQKHVRDIDAASPARFNADPTRLYEAAGCAGKLAVFALRLDTFPLEPGESVYYIGTNDVNALTVLRRRILRELPELPISGEYIHRAMFDMAHVYGKDTLLLVLWFGTDYLPRFFKLKGWLDASLNKLRFLPKNLADRIMQLSGRLVPEVLPERILRFRDGYEHHLILRVSGRVAAETEQFLDQLFEGSWFLCTKSEAKLAMLHRFVCAGAVVRYHALNENNMAGLISLDVALRRNDEDWMEVLPSEIDQQMDAKLYYGHFLCYVFHQDYVVRKGCDIGLLKKRLLKLLDARGAEYPAEHNVGHLYKAKPALRAFYKILDPTNSFNAGIGKTSKQKGIY